MLDLSRISPDASPPTMDLTSFSRSRATAAHHCHRDHPGDITRWCQDCATGYLDDLRAGDDWMGGMVEGVPRRGFWGHPESLDVINDALAEMPPFVPDEPESSQAAAILNRHGDDFLGEEERSLEIFSSTDLQWAAENLDPTVIESR
jgi:hypothetical protein